MREINKEIMLKDIFHIFTHFRQCGDDGNTTKYIDVDVLYKKIKSVLSTDIILDADGGIYCKITKGGQQ